MSLGWIIFIIILVILIAGLVALYFFGRRAQARQDEQQAQIDANSQNVSMLIIDKKRLRMKESGLPQQVIDQTPFYAKLSKVPVVKAKVGPQIMTFICDDLIFDDIPVKKEVKARISGLYITSVRGLHGKIEKEDTKKRRGLRAWARRKQAELR